LESDANVADAPGQQEGGRERGLSDATRSSGAEDSSDQSVVAGKGELGKAVDSALSMPKWILAIFMSVFLVVVAVIIVNVVSPQTSDTTPAPTQTTTYSGTDLAANLKQGAIQHGYRPDRVQVECSDAPKRAGATSVCTVVRNTIAVQVQVTYTDDQGDFVVG